MKRAGLRALLPLAGQTLIEYQARCLAALGAAPVLVLVERLPVALNDAFERLRGEGISVVAVSDAVEAASRFEAGTDVILLADGVAPDMSDVGRVGEEIEPVILTVPDDEDHDGFERIDATHRWAGLARLPAALVGATAAMIGDWDLQSTLLRRAVQSGARLVPAANGEGAGPFLADGEAMAGFERRLLLASRGARSDWVSRFILPVVEEVATERLMETRLRPEWLVRAALALTLGAALAFTRGWLWQGLVALVARDPARPRRAAHRLAAPAPAQPVAPGQAHAVARGGARACSRWAGSRRAMAGAGGRWSPRWPPPPSPRRRGSSAAPSEPPVRALFLLAPRRDLAGDPVRDRRLVEPLSRPRSRSTPRRASSSPSTVHHRVARD